YADRPRVVCPCFPPQAVIRVDGETDIASDSFLLSRTQFARDVAVSDCRLSLWRGNRKAGRPDARPEPSTRGAALPWAPFPRAPAMAGGRLRGCSRSEISP